MDKQDITIDKSILQSSVGDNSKGSVSSILSSKSVSNSFNSQMLSGLGNSLKDLDRLTNLITKRLDTINTGTEEYKNQVKKLDSFKGMNKDLSEIESVMYRINRAMEKGVIKEDELNSLYHEAQIIITKTNTDVANLDARHKQLGKSLHDNANKLKEINVSEQQRNEDAKALIKDLKEEEKQLKRINKEANKSLGEAVSKKLSGAASKLRDIANTINIQKIADSVERSSKSIIQEELQIAFGANREQFNDFKKDIYGSFDTSLYSEKEVLKVFGDLKQIGIGSAESAKEQFKTLLQGQSLLGMSADTQQKLVELGNRTGVNQLKFTTNQVAKYMKTATNLSKDQLNELISMNASLALQASDSGVDSKEFMESLNNSTVALSNLMNDDGDTADKYRNLVSQSIANENATSKLFGMNEAQMREFWNSGKDVIDLFNSGNGLVGQIYNQMRSSQGGYDYIMDNKSKYEEAGIDQNTFALMQRFAKKELQGTNLRELIDNTSASQEDLDNLNKLEEARNATLGSVQKSINAMTAWWDKNHDWILEEDLQNSLSGISIVLDSIATLVGLIATKDLLSGFKNFFGKGGAGNNFIHANGKGLAGKAGSALNTGATKLGLRTVNSAGKAVATKAGTATGIGMIAAGTIWAATDGIAGYNKTSKELYGDDATTGERLKSAGAALLSGSKVHKDKDGKVDVGKNAGKGALSGAGKGALIGAGIGTLFGPGVGTAIGAAIGGGIGAIGGALTGWWKGSKAKKEEQEQKKEQERQTKELEEIKKNTSSCASQLISQTQMATRSIPSYRGIGSGDIGNSSPSPSARAEASNGLQDYLISKALWGIGGNETNWDKFTGDRGQMLGPWYVTSPFGWRNDPGTGERKYHNGIDLSKSGTQEIYAAHEGIVKLTSQGPAANGHNGGKGFGPYGVSIIASDGTRYDYGHMKARYVKDKQEIPQGTHLGTMGDMGYSYGQHLHFQVNKDGSAVDPVPFLNDSIWNGTPSKDSALTASSSSNNSSLNDKLNKTYKVQLRSFLQQGTGDLDSGPITSGLKDIKDTLISLSGNQSRDEQIMRMLQGREKPTAKVG